MQNDIEFYFDFASPYAYFAACRIDSLAAAHGRKVVWKPVLLTALCETTGVPPAPLVPLKWEYAQRDVARIARAERIPYHVPPGYPRILMEPGRAMIWIARQHGEEKAAAFARACFQAYFGDGVDISDQEVLAGVGGALGLDPAALLLGMRDDDTKAGFKQASAQALEQGVFGVPFVIADGEPFWGFDRFHQLETWLAAQRLAA